MSKARSVLILKISLSCNPSSHFSSLTASTTCGTWNSSTSSRRMGSASNSALRVALPTLERTRRWPRMNGPPTATPMSLPSLSRDNPCIHTFSVFTSQKTLPPTNTVWPPSKVMKCGSPKAAHILGLEWSAARGGAGVVVPATAVAPRNGGAAAVEVLAAQPTLTPLHSVRPLAKASGWQGRPTSRAGDVTFLTRTQAWPRYPGRPSRWRQHCSSESTWQPCEAYGLPSPGQGHGQAEPCWPRECRRL
mmetsp:Transcript_531/g.1425  ORF Transcript_531/g.1425 Transcript_531/m.1425 type:complete len:248 (-) Transcript_531:386-1129(-)